MLSEITSSLNLLALSPVEAIFIELKIPIKKSSLVPIIKINGTALFKNH